jgi:hypothetical protein
VFEVADPVFVAKSGTARHAIVRFNGRDDSRVRGTLLELTNDELARADRYEPAGYERVSARLASGKAAWVYAAARMSIRVERLTPLLAGLRHADVGRVLPGRARVRGRLDLAAALPDDFDWGLLQKDWRAI